MQLQLQVARAVRGEIPDFRQVQSWAAAALQKIEHRGGELTVRVVDQSEMSDLNARYRGKRGPTNVLSFPVDADGLPPDMPGDMLGDVVICASVVAVEAASREMPLMNHWAHMVIHGVLHLCGFDHQRRAEAERMESLERGILADLGISRVVAP